MVLLLQQSAFLDSAHLDMDKIYQCPQSVQSVYQTRRDALTIFAAARIELSKMVSVTMLLFSSCRRIIFGSPARCLNCTLDPSTT